MNRIPVAQVSNLRYRRVPLGWACVGSPGYVAPLERPQAATGGCQPAIRQSATLRYEHSPVHGSNVHHIVGCQGCPMNRTSDVEHASFSSQRRGTLNVERWTLRLERLPAQGFRVCALPGL